MQREVQAELEEGDLKVPEETRVRQGHWVRGEVQAPEAQEDQKEVLVPLVEMGYLASKEMLVPQEAKEHLVWLGLKDFLDRWE